MDQESGICQYCKKEGIINRTYFHYTVSCECHSPNHFEVVFHCNECQPTEPKETKIVLKTSGLKYRDEVVNLLYPEELILIEEYKKAYGDDYNHFFALYGTTVTSAMIRYAEEYQKWKTLKYDEPNKEMICHFALFNYQGQAEPSNNYFGTLDGSINYCKIHGYKTFTHWRPLPKSPKLDQ